jgi:hypothetical protein
MLIIPFVFVVFHCVNLLNSGPSDGSFMLGCDGCDRWFHGSCMKIDKTTGDALSNWNCPQCSKSVIAKADDVNDDGAMQIGEQMQHAQESIAKPPVAQQPPLDVSPHAPNPMTLWPPLGLRGSKESSEALGQVGESDNEDFVGPIQPISREKPESLSSQFYVPSSVVSSSIPSISQIPSCQLAASAANSTAPSVFCQPVSSTSMAHLSQNPAGISQYVQRTVPTNPFSVRSAVSSQPVKTAHPPTAFPRLSLAPTTTLSAPSAAKPGYHTIANSLNVIKTNYPATALTQLSLAPASTFAASSAALHASIPGNQAMANSLKTMGLNGADLSVAVANMDVFVLTAGDSPGLEDTPSAATQGNIVNSAPSKSDQPSVQ